MRLKQKMRTGVSRVARAALAAVLVVGLAPSVAFADLAAGSLAKDSGGMDPDGYVIAAAYAAANPAPEILGLNNPQQRSTGEADQTYNFFGDPEINVNPDPFLYNYKNGKTPGVYIGGRGGSPMSALNDYDADDPTQAQNAVWELQPHVILGTGSDTIPANEHDFYAGNARAVETALGLEANSYNPIGVTYNRTSLPTMIQTMYRLAAAANEVIENSDGELQARYGDPMAIAQDYERYIVGQKGLVKKAIDTGLVEQKTIALVQSYDATAGTYTIITDGVAEGTATTNRYLEAVQGVTYNYYDAVGAAGATSVTSQQLAENVDVIILGTASGTDNTGSVADYLSADNLLGKTYYCVNWANGSAFGTTVNSVENAQNVGRILPCVYPKVLDQSDMIAYYYETFYHLKTDEVANVMAERMDGVRNWGKTDSASYTSWETSDYEGYLHDDVEALLKSGVSYLNSQSGQSDYLTPTDNVAIDSKKIDLGENANVVVASAVLQNGKAEPEPVVTYGATTLVKDSDYTVSYANNTAVGTATVTVAAVEGSAYEGSKSAEFQVLEADNFSNLEAVLAEGPFTFTAKAIQPKVTIANGATELVEGTDFVVNYANNVKVGTATATMTGIGNYAGSIEKEFAITPHETSASVSCTDVGVGDALSISTSVDGAYTNDGGKALAISFSPEDAVTVTSNQRGTTYTAAKLGEVTITATGQATENCTAPSATTTITIKKNISKLSINKFDATYAYTGEEIAIAPTFKDADGNKLNLVEGTDYTITVKQGGKDAALKELGEYTVTLAGIGEYAGKVEKTVTVVPHFSVKTKDSAGNVTVVKKYDVAEAFAALKSASSDPISALYNAGTTGWYVATTNSYVTLVDLVADAGVDLGDGDIISWEGKNGATTSYTYAELKATQFFPNAVGSGTHDADGAVAAPLVFALTQAACAVDTSDSSKPQTAAAAQTANLASQSSDGCPRTIVGISEADYENPSADGAKTAGMRLWNNINAITITTEGANAVMTAQQQATKDLTAAKTARTAAEKAKAEADEAQAQADASQSVADAAVAQQKAQAYKAAAEAAKTASAKATASAAAFKSAVETYPTEATAEQATLAKNTETAANNQDKAANTAVSQAAEAVTKADQTADTAAKKEKEAADTASAEANLANGSITIASGSYVYAGKAFTPTVSVKSKGGKTLAAGTDYTVAYANNVNAGTATVTVTGKGTYNGSKSATFAIAKANGAVAFKAAKKTLTIKAGKSLKAAKAFKVTKNVSKGKVTYKKTKGNKKITVAKGGKITVKKGLKAGTYKIRVKATSAATANYNAATSKVVTIKIKVK